MMDGIKARRLNQRPGRVQRDSKTNPMIKIWDIGDFLIS